MIRRLGPRDALLGALGVLAFFLVWGLGCAVFRVPSYVVPSPLATARTLVDDAALLARHTGTTLAEAGLGLVVALAFGTIAAILMTASRVVRGMLYPSLVLSQAVPLVAVAPLVLIWFGLGSAPKALVAAFVCFFPIVVNAMEGFRSIDPAYAELLKTLGARRRDLYRHVYLPGTLPGILAGLRVAATYCVLGAVVGEWLGGSRGLGVYMTRALQSFRTDRMFAAIVVVMVASYALFKLVDGVGRRLVPWIERRNHA